MRCLPTGECTKDTTKDSSKDSASSSSSEDNSLMPRTTSGSISPAGGSRSRGFTGRGGRDLEKEELDAEELDLGNLGADWDESSPVECRPAFAYHSKLSRSFKEMGFVEKTEFYDSNVNWGWSNGPLLSSNYAYSFDIYAEGEKDNDPMVLVGAMTVGYDGEEAVVTVDAGEGLWLENVQAHVGTTRLPLLENGSETMDPSEYPIEHTRMSLSRSFVVSDFQDESIYVVAEATVCGVFSKQQPTGVRGGDSWFQSARGLLKGF